MTDNTVIVYPADLSKPGERHTRANARDLVNGAGYTWARGLPTTPASIAPFANFSVPDGPAPSQSVLDSVGSSASKTGAAASAAQNALAEQQAQMAALAAQQAAQMQAAQAEPEVVADFSAPVADFSAPVAVDASDLDDPADEADAAEEAEAEIEATVADAEPAPRRRGRPPKNA